MKRIHLIALIAAFTLLMGLLAVPVSAAGHTGTVEGTALDTRGRPVRHAEVFLLADPGGPMYTCTDKHGEFSFTVEPGELLFSATGPAVDPGAGCANSGFEDKQGHPYLVAFAALGGPVPIDTGDVVTIDFTVEFAESYQWTEATVRVSNPTIHPDYCNGRGSCSEVPSFNVVALDMNSPDFVPPADPSDYPGLYWSGDAQITNWSNWALAEYPGAFMRYPYTTDVFLIMYVEDADAGEAAYQAATTTMAEFRETGLRSPITFEGPAESFKITKTIAGDGSATLSGAVNKTFVETLP